jgi:mono/diheme cytochrome c family protein
VSRLTVRTSRLWVGLGLAAVAAVAAVLWWSASQRREQAITKVVVPPLGALAQQGERAFGRNCAACHGLDAGGSGKGPPLINRIYAPDHHPDSAIARAIARGVPAHHWAFGDMPPQPQVTADQTRAIIAYLRDVQRANGIY